MADIVAQIQQKFFDANGNPLAGGKLFSYQAGTTTPLVTYANQDQTTENTNPVILDANGEAYIFVGPNAYKFVLKDANDIVLRTVDNVSTTSPDSISTLMLQDRSVTGIKIALEAVEAEHIKPDMVMPADTIQTTSIKNANVTTAKIADSNVTTAKIADANVTTAKLADASVTNVKIADGTINPVKLASSAAGVSSVISSFSAPSTTEVTVTGSSLNIPTVGRPVFVQLAPAGSQASISAGNPAGGSCAAWVRLYRNGVNIAEFYFSFLLSGPTLNFSTIPSTSVTYLDRTASAGTHTYHLTLAAGAAGSASITSAQLTAVEL